MADLLKIPAMYLLNVLMFVPIGFLVVRKASRLFSLSLPLDAKEPARREDGPVRFLLLIFLAYFFLYPFWSAWLWDTLL